MWGYFLPRRLGKTPTIEETRPSSLTVRTQHKQRCQMGSAIRHVLHYTLPYTMMGGATSLAGTISLLPAQCVIITEIMAEVSAKSILGYAHQTRAMTQRWAVKRFLLAYGIQDADKAMRDDLYLLTLVSLKSHRKRDF